MQSDCDELRSHLERINSEIRITRSHNVGLARKLGPSSARSCVSAWIIDQLGGKGKNPVRGHGCHPNPWDSTCNDSSSSISHNPSNELLGSHISHLQPSTRWPCRRSADRPLNNGGGDGGRGRRAGASVGRHPSGEPAVGPVGQSTPQLVQGGASGVSVQCCMFCFLPVLRVRARLFVCLWCKNRK